MSTNRLSEYITSVEGKHLYEYPKGMIKVNRVSVGDRFLNFGTTVIDFKHYIVLIQPIEVSGAKIEVIGR